MIFSRCTIYIPQLEQNDYNSNMTILIIVESPTKAKAIQSYAGPGHQVKASFGHIRDLPANVSVVQLEGRCFIGH